MKLVVSKTRSPLRRMLVAAAVVAAVVHAAENGTDTTNNDIDADDVSGLFDVPECKDAGTVYVLCFADYEETCIQSCNETAAGLSPLGSAATCADLQEGACTFAECCPQCGSKFIDFAECLVQNANNAATNDCTFSCANNSAGAAPAAGNATARWLMVLGSVFALLMVYY